MKIKLTKLHLFLILLTVLISSSLGIKVLEGMGIIEGMTDENASSGANSGIDYSDKPLVENPTKPSDGEKHNPFNNADELSLIEDENVEGDFEDTTFNPDVRVTFQDSNPSNKKLSYGAKSGISKNQIPPGQEHLYILKSQMVPPNCPKCPDVKGRKGDCPKVPPCPAPQRCPEPAFTCKKVPNYSAANVDSILPGGSLDGNGAGAGTAEPVLNSFAAFS
tara:strand:- start:8146 stop:8805 length:660 start_codon:yes stop_codon:yes gene_type:complete